MLNSAIWKNNATLNIDQTVPNGSYQLYLWVMENYQSFNRKFNVVLEGTQVALEIGYLPKNSWVKYGPYTATVTDGKLDLDLVQVIDSPHIKGMAIYQQTGGEAPTPTSTSTPTATPTPTNTPTPTPTPAGAIERELLGTTWTLSGNNGAAEKDKTIPANSLSGKTAVKVTFNLQGHTFGSGHDEASLVFVQNGDWRVANLIANGGQNGLNGSQTITIPISKFHKVGNTSVVLDPNQPVSNLHARFWKNAAFTVTITSVKAL
jgi:hypothetical protein